MAVKLVAWNVGVREAGEDENLHTSYDDCSTAPPATVTRVVELDIHMD